MVNKQYKKQAAIFTYFFLVFFVDFVGGLIGSTVPVFGTHLFIEESHL